MAGFIVMRGSQHLSRGVASIALALATAVYASAAPARPFAAAGLCVTPKRGDQEGNLARLDQWARAAAARGAQLVITPESFVDGYVAKQAKLALPAEAAPTPGEDGGRVKPRVTREAFMAAGESLDGPLMSRLGRLAAELKIYFAVGFSDRRGDEIFNATVLFSPTGEPVLRYAKTHNEAGHEIYTTLGAEFPVTDTPHGRWGTLICFDRQLPEPARILALKGAAFVMVPSFGGYSELNDALVRTRAVENGMWVFFVHPHRGLLVDPKGKVVAESQGDHDQIVLASIACDEAATASALATRRPEIYQELVAPRPR